MAAWEPRAEEGRRGAIPSPRKDNSRRLIGHRARAIRFTISGGARWPGASEDGSIANDGPTESGRRWAGTRRPLSLPHMSGMLLLLRNFVRRSERTYVP